MNGIVTHISSELSEYSELVTKTITFTNTAQSSFSWNQEVVKANYPAILPISVSCTVDNNNITKATSNYVYLSCASPVASPRTYYNGVSISYYLPSGYVGGTFVIQVKYILLKKRIFDIIQNNAVAGAMYVESTIKPR